MQVRGWAPAGLAVAVLTLLTGCAGSPEVAKPVPKGILHVFSNPPGAEVHVDDKLRGRTESGKPLVVKDLPYGPHRVRVAKPDFIEREEEVVVNAPLAERNFRLGRTFHGRLRVLTDPPGAEVYIDAQYQGLTAPDITLPGLPRGPHTLWVRKRGFKDVTRQILLGEGQDELIEIRLVPEK